MSDPSPKHDPYAPWRNRDYRRYASSWFGATFSRRLEFVAASVYFVNIYGENNAPLALGMLGLVLAMPVILLAIAGGQIADRFSRCRILTVTLAVNVLLAIGLVVVALLEASPLWIYLLMSLGAVSKALGGPSRLALLPQLVAPKIFSNAVTWNTSIFYIASVTGPAIAGVMMGVWVNPAPTFALAVVCRMLAVVAIASVRVQHTERSAESVSWRSVVAGIRFVWRTKLILATITLDLFAVLLGGATYLLPIYAINILEVGPSGLGFLLAADAVGAICMAMVLVHLPPMRRAGITLLWAVAGYGVATIIFGLSTWFWLSMVMMFFVGALDNISVVVRHTLVQLLTPDEMRGRVSAVNSVFVESSNELGGLESGLTAWLFTPAISVVSGGIGTILVVLGAMCLWPQILAIGSLAAIKPAAEEETSHV